MADQSLSLKIDGDSSGGVGAVTDIMSTLQSALDAMGGASAQMSASIQSAQEDFSNSLAAMSGMAPEPFVAMSDAAATSSASTQASVVGLFDELAAATVGAVAGMGESIEGLGEKIEKGFADPIGSAKGMLTDFVNDIGPLGVGLTAIGAAATAVGAGLYELANSAAETGESIRDFSLITGTSVDKIGTLSAEATIAGSSLDSMQSMLTQMQRRLDATGPSADKFNAALGDLNINVDAFRAADPTDRLQMLAAGMQASAGSTNLMSDALAIMGRSGVSNIAPLMKMTTDLQATSAALGYQWSDQNVEDSEAFEMAVRELGVAMSTLKTTIGVDIMEWFVGWGQALQTDSGYVDEIGVAVLGLAGSLAIGSLGLGEWAVAMGAALLPFAPFIAAAVATEAVVALLESHFSKGFEGMTASEEAWASQQDQATLLFAKAKAAGMDLGDSAYYVADAMLKAGQPIAVVAEQSGIGADEVTLMKQAMDAAKKSGDDYSVALEQLGNDYANLGKSQDSVDSSLKGWVIDLQQMGKTNQEIATLTGLQSGQINNIEVSYTKASAAAAAYEAKLSTLNDTIFGEKDAVSTLTDWYNRNSDALDTNTIASRNFTDQVDALVKKGQQLSGPLQDWYNKQEMIRVSANLMSIEAPGWTWFDPTTWTTLGTHIDSVDASWGALFQTTKDMDTKIASDDATALQTKLDNIETEEWAEVAALGARTQANGDFYDTQYARITSFYDAKALLAQGDSDNLTQLLHSMGLKTQAETQAELTLWENQYASLVAMGQGWSDAAIAVLNKLKAANITITDDMVAEGTVLGEGFTENFGDTLTAGIDTIMSKDLPSVLTKSFEGGGGLSGAISAMGSKIGNQMSSGIVGSTSGDGSGLVGSLFGSGAAGIGVNLVSGMATMGISTAVSVAVSLLSNLFKSHIPTDIDNIGQQYGVALTSQMEKTIQDSMQTLGITEQAATILNTATMFPTVDASNFADALKAVHDAFSMVQTGQLSAAQGGQVLDDMWTKLVTVGTDATGILSQGMQTLMQLNQQFGTDSSAIATYQQQQMTAAATGIGAAVKVTSDAYTALAADQTSLTSLQSQMDGASASQQATLQTQIDATNADMLVQQGIIMATGIHSQDAATAIASAVVGSIDSEIAAGKTLSQAITDNETTISGLQTMLQQTGYTGGAAFDFIEQETAMVTDKIAGPAITAVDGYAAGLVGLANAGQLNQDTFEGLTSQIGQTESALQAQGYSEADVMGATQKDLQSVWELEQQYGYKADDTTQKLIDQAQQAGLVGEAQESTGQQTVDALNKVVDKLNDLLTGLGIDMPNALDNMVSSAQTAATQVTGALNAIPTSFEFTMNGTINMPDMPDGSSVTGAGTAPFPSFANRPMEQVTSQGYALLHPGDVVGVPQPGQLGMASPAAIAHLAAMSGGIDNLNDTMTGLPDVIGRKVRDAVQMATA